MFVKVLEAVLCKCLFVKVLEAVLCKCLFVKVLETVLCKCLFVKVLEMRIPFLLSSIKDFQQHVPNGQDSMVGFCFYASAIVS